MDRVLVVVALVPNIGVAGEADPHSVERKRRAHPLSLLPGRTWSKAEGLTAPRCFRHADFVEALHGSPARAGLLDGWIEADPTLVGVVIAVLVVAALLYVFVYSKERKHRRG